MATVQLTNLPDTVDEEVLQKLFASIGPYSKATIRHQRIIANVVFDDEETAKKAVDELNGTELNGKIIEVDMKRRNRRQKNDGANKSSNNKNNAAAAPQEPPKEVNPKRVFVGGLKAPITEEEVKATFESYGIEEFMMAKNKRFAMITFNTVDAADKAVAEKAGLTLQEIALKVEKEKPNTRQRSNRQAPAAGGAKKTKKPNPRRVWVGNLPEGITKEEVESAFDDVKNVKLRQRYAYVTFETVEAAQAVIAKNGTAVIAGQEPLTIEPSSS